MNDYIRRQNDKHSDFRNMFCFSTLTLFLYLSSSFVCTNLINQPIERSADSDADCIFTHEINVTASRDHPVMSSDADNHHLKRGNKNFDCYESRIVMKPRTACTSPILKNSTMGITHATGVNVCVDGHINHLGATNALWLQEHGIKPQCDHRHACVFINANQINWQHVSDCFRLVMRSTPQPRTMIVTMCGTSCWPRGQRECGGGNFSKAEIE